VAGIFSKAGDISDIYIPSHQGPKRIGRYGFVRFFRLVDARRCVSLFNRRRIRGMRIHVSMAKPKKQTQNRRRDQRNESEQGVWARMEWRKKEGGISQSVINKDQAERALQTSIIGQPNEEMEEWLARTLVCTTEEPRDLGTLESALLGGFGQPFKLRELNCCQFLVTLPTTEIMSEVLENQEELEQWFVDIKKWGVEDCCVVGSIRCSPTWIEMGEL